MDGHNSGSVIASVCCSRVVNAAGHTYNDFTNIILTSDYQHDELAMPPGHFASTYTCIIEAEFYPHATAEETYNCRNKHQCTNTKRYVKMLVVYRPYQSTYTDSQMIR